eukprot:CAMPEP_0177634638 /NCGR_PEP_ID=MMETSP0447-20121125/3474_1 /TAXON_ID=0 /ORGANISM="Stygamoeba regulata, Strain BSH-02190019" /LENGTH=261 /DNA_ID=CAMNT_0019136371 /DNA_START=139 /DNA_END=924 /DNA_ORIENTATION=-
MAGIEALLQHWGSTPAQRQQALTILREKNVDSTAAVLALERGEVPLSLRNFFKEVVMLGDEKYLALCSSRPGAGGSGSGSDSSGGASGSGTRVFINEIHYDNVGKDVGEGVEIAAPIDTSLAGWVVCSYNGRTGKLVEKRPVAGALSDAGGGMGVVFVALELQNGWRQSKQRAEGDGIALLNAAGAVVQFISYEGSFTAKDGPARGMTAADICVMEGEKTPVGHSLQLVGRGRCYEDFSWRGPQPHSFGRANSGQVFVAGG